MSHQNPPKKSRRVFLALAALCTIGVVVQTIVVLRRSEPPANRSKSISAAPPVTRFVPPPPLTHPERQLRPALVEALGYSTGISWSQRIDHIRSLPKELNNDEIDALLTAMIEKCPAKISPIIHATYMHEIACLLQRREDVRARFAQALASLAQDTQQDDTTRDYAVQHLRQVWSRASGDPALRGSIVSTFRDFTTLDPVLATSGILSLHLLGTDPMTYQDGVDQDSALSPDSAPPATSDTGIAFAVPDADLIPFLESVFSSTTAKADVPARLTAVRIAGERRLTTFRKSLLEILKNPSEHTLVRMAAANAIGEIADPADLEGLASFDSKDPRVQAALLQALKSDLDP